MRRMRNERLLQTFYRNEISKKTEPLNIAPEQAAALIHSAKRSLLLRILDAGGSPAF